MRYWRIALLLSVALFLAMLTSHGLNLSFDDVSYYIYAKQMLNGTFTIQQSPYAYGFAYPAMLAFSMLLFGQNVHAASYPNAASFILLLLAIYFLGKRYYNANLALLGSLLVAFSAFIVIYAFRAIPDMPIGAFIALSLLLVSKQTRRGNTLSGLLVGAIIFLKVGSLLYMPFLLFGLALFSKPRSLVLYWLAGWLFSLSIYFSIASFLAPHLNVVSSYSSNQVHLSSASLLLNFYTLCSYTFCYLPYGAAWAQVFPLAALLWIAILGSILVLKDRVRQLAMYYTFLWLTFFYLLFGTESLSNWAWIVVVSRYFIPLAPAMTMLALYPISLLYKRISSNIILVFVALSLIAILVLLSNLPMLVYAISHIPHYIGAPINASVVVT